MTLARAAVEAFKSSALVSWRSTGKLQQTIGGCIEKTGRALHSGNQSTVRIWPELSGKGRYFDFCSRLIPASIDFVEESPLCTTLRKDGHSVRTVEHLLSALEGTGVDNCRIEILNSDHNDPSVEVPIFDGSAKEWVEAIEQVGLTVAMDRNGRSCDKLAPYLTHPVLVSKGDSVISAFPSKEINISYGINFPQVSAISLQWFSSVVCTDSFFSKQIAPSRTFCIYEEVEKMRNAGLIKGGSIENAVVFSTSKGLLNPPLRSPEEPCRHKILDLIGDVSLFARDGSQGIPVANIVAYKGSHALHAAFVRQLSGIS
ncbi:probable UDP-3-O-acyl-N-acetylglucosamine deacetylase 2, mitochondrial [Cynara cardunculus var. scolymus]|uniref:UDP-3-O-acyl-N-acetylglucosamine deacetylase n=1 Tax=Cynara cardunculus var. scolymus TaxID=59895 RepID=A0A118JXJ6_CYNCS|nr:probable UDP-3-O-acyl-N-acetylglucosamine deacetylase 2, mitochondrial [Cynara cardunculus var. scolymus]XP_024995102.1 probable UDP-3-O-acyl-N-acetylglucosamine deacetylase 2, mitochondrial [Cynara cardunculus var. scolymus]KVH96207.1 Ribosomal protein S5 domain 2-type fold [Cynara cardunculus var. scolymus]